MYFIQQAGHLLHFVDNNPFTRWLRLCFSEQQARISAQAQCFAGIEQIIIEGIGKMLFYPG